jgi:hypothetical protein
MKQLPFILLLLVKLACSTSAEVTEPPKITLTNVAEPTLEITNTPIAEPTRKVVITPFTFKAIVPNLLIRRCPDKVNDYKKDCSIIMNNTQPLYVSMSQDSYAYKIAQGGWLCLDEQCKSVTKPCENGQKYVIVTTQGYKPLAQICENEEQIDANRE